METEHFVFILAVWVQLKLSGGKDCILNTWFLPRSSNLVKIISYFLLRWVYFESFTLSQTRPSWPLPSVLSCQPLFPPRLQRSPHCLLRSRFPQQKKTGSASSHITGGLFQAKRDQRQPRELRRNHRVPRVRLSGRRSRQHVSIRLNVWRKWSWLGRIPANLPIPSHSHLRLWPTAVTGVNCLTGHWFIAFCLV